MSFATKDKPAQSGAYPDAEVEFIRERFKLPADADATPWVEYARAWSVHRMRCKTLVTWILTQPELYERQPEARAGAERCGDRLLAEYGRPVIPPTYAEDGACISQDRSAQSRLSLAVEICGESGGKPMVEVFRRLIDAKWLPVAPRRPDSYAERQAERTRRSGITEAQRQANAERTAVEIAP